MIGNLDHRLLDTVVTAFLANASNPAADLLDHAHAVEHPEQQAIARYALDPQVFLAHPRGQPARRHDLQAVVENVHLHVGGRPIVPVCDGIHQRLANRVLGKLQALISAVDVRDQRRVQLGLGVGDALLVDGVEVTREVLEVEDVGLGHAPQQSARHGGLQAVLGDVLRQQPCAGLRHLPVPEEMQVLQRDQRLHAVGDASARGEARPCFRRQVALQIEARAGRLVETDESFLVEGLADLVAGHLLAVRAFTDVEPATEGIGLAMLIRHRHDQYVVDRLHFDRDRRICGACGGLDLRLQPVVVLDSDSIILVGDADEDHPTCGVCERADFGSKVGRHRALELGGESLAERRQMGEPGLTHVDQQS